MNIQKTEMTTLFKKYEDWKNMKKIGSLIDCQVDVQHRINLAKVQSTDFGNSGKNNIF